MKKFNAKKEREKIGITLLSLYENPALKMLATRINNLNRKKEKQNITIPITNNYTYEFENIIRKYAGTETKLVMKCVLELNSFNDFIGKCIEFNLTLYNFKYVLTNLHTDFLYLNERYIKGSDDEKLIVISPLVTSIIDALNENFHEYISNTTKEIA